LGAGPSYFNGLYHIYYAYSAFGKNTSGIALVTNKTLDSASPDFKWVDKGIVLISRADDDFNAIDPNIAFDAEGILGSASEVSGVESRCAAWIPRAASLRRGHKVILAGQPRAAGEPATQSRRAAGNWQAVEAPVVVRHGDYYYLFGLFRFCAARGVKSNYRTMVGRSKNITGPYVDASGKSLLLGGATQLLVGNSRWVGPGGESVLLQPEGDIIVFHAYDGKTGKPWLQISSLTWTDGWPHAALDDGSSAAANGCRPEAARRNL